MKQKLYFLLLMFSSFPLVSIGQITLTQSTSNTIAGGTVTCNSGSPDSITNDNIHYRAFDLDALGYPSGFHVTEVSFGIEEIYNESSGFSVDVVIYETDDFPGGTLNLVSSVSVPLVSSDSGTIKSVPISARVRSKYLVYAISIPNENAAGYLTRFFIGSNDLGETSPSYISSNECGITTPTTLVSLGFNNHYVMFLEGFPMATHLNFDGVNDYVTLTNESNFDFTNQMTAEFWMNSNVIPEQWDPLITKGDNSWRVALNSTGTIAFAGTNAFTDFNSTTVVTDGNWHHIAVSYDGINAKIYVDGNLENQVVATAAINNSSYNVTFGANLQFTTRYFTGNMDEVRIWNTVRTAEQISGSMNCELQGTETGLIAYYNFNQGDAATDNTGITTLTDATANANNGTLTNFALNGSTSNWLTGSPVETGTVVPSSPSVTNITYNQGDTASALTATIGANGTGLLWYTMATGGTGSTTAPTPTTATAGTTSYWVSSTNANGCESERVEIVVTVNAPATHLNFDGVNDNVAIGNIIPNASSYTKEAWVYNTTNSGARNIISSDSNPFWISNGSLSAGNSGSFSIVQDASAFPLNTWTHVAVTYDATTTTMKLYKGGTLIATNTTAPTFVAENSFIGSHAGANSFFLGNIDEVRIWNTVRTAEQISGSMNCELQGTETGLIAYYNFNQGFDAADNTGITTLTDATANANNGTLTNFALNGSTSNWLAGSPVETGSVVPSSPSVTNITYNQGDTASALTATIGANGTGLLWYTMATGGTGSTTAPTPTTATAGTTSYWVSSTNANGCESERVEIVVNVNAPATHLNFDGVNDYVSIAPGTLNNLTQGTIETWVYLNALDNQTICAKQSNSENSYAVLTVGGGHGESSPITGRIFYKSKNGSAITSNTILTTSQWYHLAVTITSTQANLYINGVLDNTVSGNFSVPNDLTVTATTLGSWLGDGGGQYLNGSLDEFRVWNIALTQADIQATMNCEAQAQPQLIAYYKFNQGFDNADNAAITTLIDETGTYNGTLTNFTLTGAISNWQSGSTITTGNTCATLSTSGFEQISNLKVYPNPSTGIFTIATQESGTLEVYDLVGKVIIKQSMTVGSNSVDISNYVSGIYLLKVTNASGNVNTYKIIKQ